MSVYYTDICRLECQYSFIALYIIDVYSIRVHVNFVIITFSVGSLHVD